MEKPKIEARFVSSGPWARCVFGCKSHKASGLSVHDMAKHLCDKHKMSSSQATNMLNRLRTKARHANSPERWVKPH